MRISLVPQGFTPGTPTDLSIIKDGDALIVNGERFDFSPVGDGDTLPAAAIASKWFLNQVDRIGGELIFTMLLPLPWNSSQEQLFPAPIENIQDGPVQLPQPLSEEATVSKLAENPMLANLLSVEVSTDE